MAVLMQKKTTNSVAEFHGQLKGKQQSFSPDNVLAVAKKRSPDSFGRRNLHAYTNVNEYVQT